MTGDNGRAFEQVCEPRVFSRYFSRAKTRRNGLPPPLSSARPWLLAVSLLTPRHAEFTPSSLQWQRLIRRCHIYSKATVRFFFFSPSLAFRYYYHDLSLSLSLSRQRMTREYRNFFAKFFLRIFEYDNSARQNLTRITRKISRVSHFAARYPLNYYSPSYNSFIRFFFFFPLFLI